MTNKIKHKLSNITFKHGRYVQQVVVKSISSNSYADIWGDSREEVEGRVKEFLVHAGVEVKSDSGDGTVDGENKI